MKAVIPPRKNRKEQRAYDKDWRTQVVSINSRLVTLTTAGGNGTASCAASEVVVGGGCACTGSQSSGANFGILFSCRPAGNSYVGGCFDHLYNSTLPSSPIDVRVICMRTPAVTGSVIGVVSTPVSQPDAAAAAELLKVQQQAIESQLAR